MTAGLLAAAAFLLVIVSVLFQTGPFHSTGKMTATLICAVFAVFFLLYSVKVYTP
jgi:hypothetical protein